MICPICKNTMGFVCGMCINCGYNQHTNEFEKIEVNVKVLEALLPIETVWYLVDEHKKWKTRR